jgi:hypothetical protein
VTPTSSRVRNRELGISATSAEILDEISFERYASEGILVEDIPTG